MTSARKPFQTRRKKKEPRDLSVAGFALTRDDRSSATQGKDAPFLRIEAKDGHLRLTGRRMEATFPATVYEQGVLFLRVTLFRQMLSLMPKLKTMAIQVAADGLHFGDTKFPWDIGEMLLYIDPATAPERHPAEVLAEVEAAKSAAEAKLRSHTEMARPESEAESDLRARRGTLFEDLPTDGPCDR